MKIELKRIHYSERLSQETNAFTADLYINGKKVGETSNEGYGGPTGYDAFTAEGKQLIKEAEQFCRTLPSETFTIGQETHTVEMSLEQFIDNLVDEYINKKEIQKFRNWVGRKSKDCLLIGKPDDEVTASFRFKIPIEQIISGTNGHVRMAKAVARDVIPELKQGSILLNTNIPVEILAAAGLKEGQYVKPDSGQVQHKKQDRKKGMHI